MSFEKKFIRNTTINYAPTMIKKNLLVPSKIEFFSEHMSIIIVIF